ncbi:MAG TPA: TRAM domain-containing protein [Gemmatimonadales bacterium]|nr:TRAM domain-containing protein [Gemmatimonadales bacterium]
MTEPVRILRLAAGGDGVGRLADGRAVFVPRTAPGDVVELTRLREHRRFARAEVERLVEPAPERVEPPCPHYLRDRCGGCQLQHLAAAAQLAARRAFVGDALRRLGKLDVADPEIVPSERALGYRAKITLHRDERGRIGLHPYDRPAQVFDLEWCHITTDELNRLWRAVRARRELLPANLERLVLRLDRAGGRHLVVQTAAGPVWGGGKALGDALAQVREPAVVWYQPEGGVARAVSGAGEAFPATVFEQVHPAMGDRVRAYALELLGAVDGRHVWDLYAGIGETTDLLAERGATVESVESDARAVAHAESRSAWHRPRVRRYAARVEAVRDELRTPDLVVTNPPRTGMDDRVTATLAASGAARIVYISCDPATLARDLARLAAAYRLAHVRAFDLFPQTAHVESVALLEQHG